MIKLISQNKYLLIVLLLTIFSGFIRLYRLTDVYSILNRDEAALGYNAFMLKTIGMDEWGRRWPITLLSFGDWKLIGYPFMLSVLFQVLPLSDFTVRLPSVLAGISLIPLTYFLIKRTFKSPLLGIVSATLVSTTPIFFFYSRLAFEANVAMVFIVFCLYLLVRAKYLYQHLFIAFLLFLTTLIYNTPIFLIPIIAGVYVLSQGILTYKKWIFALLIYLTAFILSIMATWPVLTQKTGITIFTDSASILRKNEYRASFSGPFQKLLGNQYVFYTQTMSHNLFNSFSYNFLVKKGGTHPWHSLPGWGHISSISYAMALMGSLVLVTKILGYIKSPFKLLRQGFKPKYTILIVSILSILPATITIDAPHATRSLLFIYGLSCLLPVYLIEQAGKRIKISQAFSILAILLIISGNILYFGRYLIAYFELNAVTINELRPEYNNIVQELNSNESNVAVVADGYQYILTAWYLEYPPDQFLKDIVRGQPSLYGLRYGEKLGKWRFINHAQDKSSNDQILVYYDEINRQWVIQ